LEAGLAKYVKLAKGDFIGRGALVTQQESGLSRKLVGFTMTGRGVARAGYPVYCQGQRIGMVTSGGYCPSLEKNAGLALVEVGFSKPGQKVDIEIRGGQIAAVVTSKPLYKREELV
jgi:aminomethyltransferase